MSKILCIYHGGCSDGFGAAWVVRKYFGDEGVEFVPGIYQDPPPDVTNKVVILVDFSYKRDVMERMQAAGASITIIDHHQSSIEDLAGFKTGNPNALYTNHSGAVLAWKYFFGSEPVPYFLQHIEDRDLWKKALSGNDEFTMALRSYPLDFAVWDEISENVPKLIGEGASILRAYRKQVEEIKKQAHRALMPMLPSGNIPCSVVNAPYGFASEVAGEIIEPGFSFGACFFQRADQKWQYSLRSNGDFDVAKVAEVYGGGGHKNAAGFAVPLPVHLPFLGVLLP